MNKAFKRSLSTQTRGVGESLLSRIFSIPCTNESDSSAKQIQEISQTFAKLGYMFGTLRKTKSNTTKPNTNVLGF